MSDRRTTEPRVAVRNAADAHQVKRATETDRARQERERGEDRAVWNTYAGRAQFRRLLAQCGIYKLSMVSDPYWTAFNEGSRNVGLEALARMTTNAPDLYLLMEKEHAEREASAPSALEAAEPSTDPQG